MARYIMAENKRYMSISAFEFGSLVHIRGKINLETSEQAFFGKPGFQIP